MTFFIYTLGCKVNTYESNAVRELLLKESYQEAKDEFADIVLVNTCTVTNTADNKSLKVIKHVRKQNPHALLVVMGCLAQNHIEPLLKLEGIAIIVGNRNKTQIPMYIKEYLKEQKQIVAIENLDTKKFEDMQIHNFNKTRAFVKIQDGCNNYCSYCIIPYTRGNVCSRNPQAILAEIETLLKQGHKEIVLTGIHTGHFGSELKDYHFSNLLEDILKFKDLKRLRISSIEMNEINDEVLRLLQKEKVLTDHFHIPIQSGSDKVLKEMNRKYQVHEFIDKINRIRAIRPLISITTDLIVGFPGETDEDFKETLETLKQIQFSKIHVFPYSARKKTPAAEREDQVPLETKKVRVQQVLALSKELEIQYMEKFIGSEILFLPEVYKNGKTIGHTGNYLNIACIEECPLNQEVLVKIEKIEYPFCIAKRID